ncbi:MAG: hypothetical protein ACE5I1_31450, partial [bacterium]
SLYYAQPVTFETMKRAREFARGKVEVSFFSAQYPEDRPLIPEGFQMTPDLDRSVLDLGSFKKKRKLPVKADIMDRLYEASDAEYFIYTDVDIAVMPYFYVAVNRIIDEGYDAFDINRRSITEKYRRIDQIPLMYAEIGKQHPGHDCFVYRRDVYPKYKMGAICIGTPFEGKVHLWNLVCHATKFKEFERHDLTFHIGNPMPWHDPELDDYKAHNKNEALKVMAEIEKEYGPFDDDGPFSRYPLEGGKWQNRNSQLKLEQH